MYLLEKQANEILKNVKDFRVPHPKAILKNQLSEPVLRASGLARDAGFGEVALSNMLLRGTPQNLTVTGIEKLLRPDRQTDKQRAARKKKYMIARILVNTLAGAGAGAIGGSRFLGKNPGAVLGALLGASVGGGTSYLLEKNYFGDAHA